VANRSTHRVNFLGYARPPSFVSQTRAVFILGNTFSAIGREVAIILFFELPPTRKREAASAIGHFIAGVLDQASMESIILSLCETTKLKPGDRVKTFRGTGRGVVVRVLEDGRVVWRSDSSESELIALAESLVKET
jgi:hypothetical protein